MTEPTEANLHKRIEDDRKAARPSGVDWSDINTYREYARGRQRATLNADQLKILSGLVRHKFSDNILKEILSGHASRLRVARFAVDDKTVTEFLFDVWVKNQFSDLMTDVLFATLRDGNHAVSIGWESSDDADNVYGGRIVLSRERWWNGSAGVFINYTDNGVPEYAVKEWTDGANNRRRTVYFPEVIFRFIRRAGWEPYNLPDDELLVNDETGLVIPGVIPWVKQDGSGIGIPFVHFSNGSDDDSRYGASLLEGGPLAFQDQINAIQHDISAAALMNGSPQTYSKGFALPDVQGGQPGEKVRITTGPGTHHHTDEEEAEWGTIQPGDLSQLERAYGIKVKALCRNTKTPLHTITGDWPSGDALYMATLPAVSFARTFADSVGPSCSTLAHRATELANAFGRIQLDENKLIRTVFEPPDTKDPLSRWTIVEKAAPHVSDREKLRLAGYTPDEIDTIIAEMKKESADKVAQAQAAFNAGPNLDALMRANGQRLPNDDDTSDDDEDE